jgi:hypothetical protein
MGTHYSEPVFTIDRTEIKIATGSRGYGTGGESQTINVYDHTHTEGHYQEVYRIFDSARYVTPADIIASARNLHELDRYLTARGAVKEGAR